MNLELNRRSKKIILILVDFLLLSLSLTLAINIVYEKPDYGFLQSLQFLNIVGFQVSILFILQAQKAFWKYFSVIDLIKLVLSLTLALIVPFLVIGYLIPNNLYQTVVLICNWFVAVVLMGFSRLIYRRISEIRGQGKTNLSVKKAIIIGAGDGGEKLIREILNSSNLPYKVIGFVDDDPLKVGKSLRGIKVFGLIELLPSLIKDKKIETVLIAIPSASDTQMRKILQFCKDTGLEIKTLPSIKYILDGKVNLSQLQEISPDDMLGREPVTLETEKMQAMIKDKIVMVTGAGGSIGRELCRQVASFYPKKIILFELTELFLYEIDGELKNKIEVIPIIGDVRNKDQVESVISQYSPEIIFHAAAYKHVPMMEKNPHEAVKTNIGGTQIVANAAKKNNVKKFVLISTDKAINPTNVMGATKRVAEMISQRIQKNSETQFITIRFGNVLGSSGSVIPLFKKQIASGGPITVTHPEIKRYFMSISEASQLVIQAATYGKGGEIFILDMGSPIKIVDLAKQMITASGLIENKDIKIEYVGLRPGEKLYEELLYKDEEVLETDHPKVKVARLIPPTEESFDEKIDSLLVSTPNEVQFKLKEIVPEYQPEYQPENNH